MKIFSYLYDKTLLWSGHPHARYYLAGVSFAESSFFPIPPDVMLVSMGLATPKRAWHYALIATIFSVIGGIFGYCIGLYGMMFIKPYILASSYAGHYMTVSNWFEVHGVWIILLAGFTPLPYKIFTITAGAMHMPLMPFVIASIIGRGLRFYLVSSLLFFTGERIQNHLRNYIDKIGWGVVFIAVGIYGVMKVTA